MCVCVGLAIYERVSQFLETAVIVPPLGLLACMYERTLSR